MEEGSGTIAPSATAPRMSQGITRRTDNDIQVRDTDNPIAVKITL